MVCTVVWFFFFSSAIITIPEYILLMFILYVCSFIPITSILLEFCIQSLLSMNLIMGRQKWNRVCSCLTNIFCFRWLCTYNGWRKGWTVTEKCSLMVLKFALSCSVDFCLFPFYSHAYNSKWWQVRPHCSAIEFICFLFFFFFWVGP